MKTNGISWCSKKRWLTSFAGNVQNCYRKVNNLYGKIMNLSGNMKEFIWNKYGKVKNLYRNVKDLLRHIYICNIYIWKNDEFD